MWADIYPSPRLIEFGKIPALHCKTQIFELVNEGLVPADFRMEIVSICGAVFQGN